MNEEKKYFKISESIIKPILIGLCFVLFGFAMLQLGINIGTNRGRFACNWAKNYQDNFGKPKDKPQHGFIDNHGLFAEVIKINENSIIVNNQEGIEKIINIKENTIFKNPAKELSFKEIKIGDHIMIIGDPNEQGQIDAILIRVFNKPPLMFKPKLNKYEQKDIQK